MREKEIKECKCVSMMKSTSDNATWDAAGDKGKEKNATVKKKEQAACPHMCLMRVISALSAGHSLAN